MKMILIILSLLLMKVSHAASTSISNHKYANISTAKEFEKKLKVCLEKQDVKCLRSITSQNIQVSFGVEPPGDKALLLYSKWKKSNFKKMLSLLKLGVKCHENKCEFPQVVSENAMGLRGGFEKVNGRWLLTYYLAGD